MSFRATGDKGPLGFDGHQNNENDKCEKNEIRGTEDFDDIINLVGSNGKFQKLILYGILAPVTIIEPWLTMSVIFLLYIPDHVCSPFENFGQSIASDFNFTELLESESQCPTNVTSSDGNSSCQFGWIYDKRYYDATIPSDYDWVCDKQEYPTLAFTASVIGNAVGTIVLGIWADRLGRKQTFFLSLAITTIGRVLCLLTPSNISAHLGSQFIAGLGFPTMYITSCTIGAEISNKDFRAWIYAFTWMIWVVGMGTLPLIAWLSRHWLTIGLITTLPCTLVFLYYKFLPESPRWLISVGRVDEAVAGLKKIAECNEKSFDEAVVRNKCKQIIIQQDQCDANYGVTTLLRNWGTARSLLLVTLSWTLNNFIYVLITLVATSLFGNPFMNFFLLAVIELPAGYLGNSLVQRMGRRWTQVLFFFICLVSSGAAAATTGTMSSVVAALVAKFSGTLTFLVGYLQGTELFPTPLRSTGMGFASTVSAIISIISPYVAYSEKYHPAYPWLANVMLSTVGVIATSFIPETLNTNLPETPEEAEQFGKNFKYFQFLPSSTKPKE